MNSVSLEDDLARLGLTQRKVEEQTDNELGQQDFMTLMIAQFRNQDPFEPMDNGEFLGQLAQFGSVDGIDRLNKAFASLSESIHSDQALQAANLVGHDVLARSGEGFLPEGGVLAGAVELEAGAQNVEIDILDGAGQLIQRLELGERPPGIAHFEWNGMNQAQELAAAGNYRIEARAVRGSQTESIEPLVSTAISSISLRGPGGGMTLNIPGGASLTMDQIFRIL
ncbi:MAG: flagellar hook assembly protein FlgD [Woeseiaceae bacterium]|nr:flagellar hook assembly protein FlgD [Woeseiaceae bacterium]